MCGISFYCSKKINPTKELEASMLAIQHRGPDGTGIYYKKINDYFVGIGHNRLSILDLSEAGKQPMDLGHGVVIAYNGEVYNHPNLQIKLQEKGYVFQGHSDTEVISLLYTELGVASFSLLQGMFAFVILDEKNKKLLVVRDSIGIKPLYLFQDEIGLFASSEIRALKAFSAVNNEISQDDVFEFFNQGFLYEPSTGYLAIKKLKPGHYLELDLVTGEQKIGGFQVKGITNFTPPLAEKINTAIQQQLVSDVPLGTFFSGGIDSSLIACYAKNNDLFFAKYHADNFSDYDLTFSNKIASYLQKPITIAEISSEHKTADELMKTVDFVAQNTEELVSDYTFWATYQLSLAAKNNGYKVMLSGMGGDEVFAGYPRYRVLKNHRLIKLFYSPLRLLLLLKIFPKKWDKKFERLVSYSREKHWPTAYARLLGYFSRRDLQRFFVNINSLEDKYRKKLDEILLNFTGKEKDKVKLAQYFDLLGFLAHNLSVSDKASMLASIELRVPLLDETVVAHGLSLSTAELLKNGQPKHALKTLLASLVPKQLTERPKTGFNPPLDGLINNLGKQRLKEEIVHAKKFIKLDSVDLLLEQHFSGAANHTYKLWQLLYFSSWVRLNSQHW